MSIIEDERVAIASRLPDKTWKRVGHGEDGEAWESMDLRVIWSMAVEKDDRLWMHVSVSRPTRLPSYSDMTRVKGLFIGLERVAYTVLAPANDHVNIHSNCLHLWAPMEGEPPLPDFSRGLGTI